MRLHDLLAALPHMRLAGPEDTDITTIAYDSRAVQPGSLFIAIRGTHVDGHDYIAQAIKRGAAALIVEDAGAAGSLGAPVATVGVANSRAALAPIAAAFYGHPGARIRVVGITGTDGKTTTTFLASAVLEGGGHTTGMIGTVDFKIAGRQWANDTRQSTPEAPEVQAMLREMVDSGCDHAVLEATSHALSAGWNRLGGCAFDVAVLTNVTHEHLDYHGSVEQYRRDKARLFEMLGETTTDHRPQTTDSNDKVTRRQGDKVTEFSEAITVSPLHPITVSGESAVGGQSSVVGRQLSKNRKVAIVNADDPHHLMFLAAAPARAERLTYAIHAPADLRAHDIRSTREGLRFRVTTPSGEAALRLQLTGDFNIANALAALAIGLAEGVPLDRCVAALEAVPGVRGRMERIEAGQPFTVLVDYAHTPGAFEKLLRIARPLTEGQLIAVFGSAGERDREKRAIQGAVAARFCDLLVLTDEDPRREDREAIINEIAAGVERANASAIKPCPYVCIPDRAIALRAAFAQARAGDIVLLLGKGHEASMIYGNAKIAWDEAGEARAALRELGYG